MLYNSRPFISYINMPDQPKVILVTGGSGLVGTAIKNIIEENKRPDEKWIFVGSKDANLW